MKAYISVKMRPLPLDAGSQKTRQPPNTNYKIYSSKKVATVRVRKTGAGDGETFVINQSDFDPDVHEPVE